MFIRPFSIPIIDVSRGGERFHPWNRYIVPYTFSPFDGMVTG